MALMVRTIISVYEGILQKEEIGLTLTECQEAIFKRGIFSDVADDTYVSNK